MTHQGNHFVVHDLTMCLAVHQTKVQVLGSHVDWSVYCIVQRDVQDFFMVHFDVYKVPF